MRIVVIGSRGQLGSELRPALQARGHDVVGLTRDDLDITNGAAQTADRLAAESPDVVINTAAFHLVDQCEDEPARAFAVNALAVRDLAIACDRVGARLAHISTDYVFGNGHRQPIAETAAPDPLSVYATSKLAGEQFVRHIGDGRSLVIRTCGLFGPAGVGGRGGGHFVATMLRLARDGRAIRVVTDQQVAPTYTPHLAAAIAHLLDADATGIVHLTASGTCSWYEFAAAIFARAGLTPDFGPTTAAEFGARARRPEYSVLAHAAAADFGVPPLPHWSAGLDAWLAASGA